MGSKKFLITGASSDIGKSLLEHLPDGSSVTALCRRKPVGHKPNSINLTHNACDLNDYQSVQKAITKSSNHIDHMVLLAGVSNRFIRFDALSIEEIEAVLRVNFFSHVMILNALSKYVTGSITVISTNSIKYNG